MKKYNQLIKEKEHLEELEYQHEMIGGEKTANTK